MSSNLPTQSTDSAILADRNYWATFKDPVISWGATLPSPAELGMARVLDFTRRVLAAAEREEVMRVLESPPPFEFKLAKDWTWYDSVRERFERLGEVQLFPAGGPTRQMGGRLRMPARLAYYKGTDIVEEEVEDPGLLLRSLHQTDDWSGRYSTTPLWLDGEARGGEHRAPGRPPTDRLRVDLSLFTDIWFPRVAGINAEDPLWDQPGLVERPIHPARGKDGMMDNSALAARHTPRLNRFIRTLREAVLELGGDWSFDRAETDERYLPMVHDEGINLDYPVASA